MENVVHHTTMGFCVWDIPAVIALALVIGICLVNAHRLRMRERELEDRLSRCYADNIVDDVLNK